MKRRWAVYEARGAVALLASELQSLAQAGLYYGKDRFDLERYQRIRDIAAR